MATYILDYSKANDDGVGTSEGTAWKNWDVALSRLAPGDILECRGVTDNLVERLTDYTPITNGTSGSHITIKNYQNETAVFKFPAGDPGETSNTKVGFFRTPVAGAHYIDFIANARGRLKFDGEHLLAEGAIRQGGFYVADNNSNIRLENVHIQNMYASGAFGGSSVNIQFVNCIFNNNGFTPWDPTPFHDYGLYASGPGLLIDGCWFYNNSGWGWHCYPHTSTGIICRNSIFYRNGYRDGADPGTDKNRGGMVLNGAIAPQIYNNLVFANRSNGIDVFTAPGALLYHNTCVNNGGSATGASSASGYGISCGITGTPTNVKLWNNLCAGNRVGSIRLASGSGFDVQWNVLQAAPSDSTSATIANNSNNAMITDEVVDSTNATYASRDYHLKAGAQSIGYGSSVGGITTDLEGTARGTIDAGAYAYVNSALSNFIPSTLTTPKDTDFEFTGFSIVGTPDTAIIYAEEGTVT